MTRTCAAIALAALLASLAVHSQELPRRSFLGVQAGALDEAARARLDLGDRRGALVLGLVDGGTAKEAGLRRDDLITAVGERAVGNPSELVAALGNRRAGERVAIHFIRDGRAQTAETALKPRPMESSPDAQTRYTAVAVDRSLRRAIVTAPRDERRHPAVLYITGIGCFSQESLDLQSGEAKLLYGLTRAGFVTMRVEKSGVGDSEGEPCASPAADFRAEVAGYVEGLKALKSLPGVDADNVFLLGLSIGGIEAPLVAGQVPVKGVVVVNTVAKPFMEYLLETWRRQGLLRGLAYDEIDRRMRLTESCNHALLIDKRSPDEVVGGHADCKDTIEYPAPFTYMQQWAALDPAAEWKRVRAPVLIVQGERDFVATAADAPYLRDMIESFRPGTATLSTIATMDHYLTRVGSMKESMEKAGTGPFEPEVVETIRGWMSARVGERAAG